MSQGRCGNSNAFGHGTASPKCKYSSQKVIWRDHAGWEDHGAVPSVVEGAAQRPKKVRIKTSEGRILNKAGTDPATSKSTESYKFDPNIRAEIMKDCGISKCSVDLFSEEGNTQESNYITPWKMPGLLIGENYP